MDNVATMFNALRQALNVNNIKVERRIYKKLLLTADCLLVGNGWGQSHEMKPGFCGESNKY